VFFWFNERERFERGTTSFFHFSIEMVKGFNRPFKNDSRRAKFAVKKAAKPSSAGGGQVPRLPTHLKGADKHLPSGLALPERGKKALRKQERYKRILEREAAAAVAAEVAGRAPKDAAMA
jgi:hypothetical protein